MKLFTPSPLRSLMGLVFLGSLCLTGCPQMTTGALNGGGAPLNATGEKTSSSTTDSDKTASDDSFVPASAAPVPSPAGGGDAGGLGGAGSGSTEYETAMRRLDGPISGSSSGDATPISGPVASRESGGILSSPSTREPVGSDAENLRVLYVPSSERRNWTDAEDFFNKLAAGQISEDLASKIKVTHWTIMLVPPADGDPPTIVARKEDLLTNDLVTEPGYYLFFYTSDELLWMMGPRTMDVASVAQLKTLVQTNQLSQETDGSHHPYQITFLGERTILPKIDVNILHHNLLPENVRINPLLQGKIPQIPPLTR